MVLSCSLPGWMAQNNVQASCFHLLSPNPRGRPKSTNSRSEKNRHEQPPPQQETDSQPRETFLRSSVRFEAHPPWRFPSTLGSWTSTRRNRKNHGSMAWFVEGFGTTPGLPLGPTSKRKKFVSSISRRESLFFRPRGSFLAQMEVEPPKPPLFGAPSPTPGFPILLGNPREPWSWDLPPGPEISSRCAG